jgi:hypothetical protein
LTVSKPTRKRGVRSKPARGSPKKTRTRAAHAKPARSRPAPPVEKPSPEHEAAYIESLIANGQAARLTKEGKLPPGATHKIVEDEQGQVKVVRRRFSIA